VGGVCVFEPGFSAQDRTYVPLQRKLLIYDQGTKLFCEVVLRHPDIRKRVQARPCIRG
jgi:hypothetical protein